MENQRLVQPQLIFCHEGDTYLFQHTSYILTYLHAATAAWRSVGAQQPQCYGHQKLAKMRIVKEQIKKVTEDHFLCVSEKMTPCSCGPTYSQQRDQIVITNFRLHLERSKRKASTRIVT